MRVVFFARPIHPDAPLKVGQLRLGQVGKTIVPFLSSLLTPTPDTTIYSIQTIPDEESVSARWVSLSDLVGSDEVVMDDDAQGSNRDNKKKKKDKKTSNPGVLKLRGDELVHWIRYLEAGGPIYPLSLLASEVDPIPTEKFPNITKIQFQSK